MIYQLQKQQTSLPNDLQERMLHKIMLKRKRSGIKTEKLVQEMLKMKGTIKGVKFCLKNFEKTTKK